MVLSSDGGGDIINVSGDPANVDRAERALNFQVEKLDAEKHERVSSVSCLILENHLKINWSFFYSILLSPPVQMHWYGLLPNWLDF